MRIFLGFLVVVAVAGGIVAQRKSIPPAPPGSAGKAVTAQAARPDEASQKNWAKRSLDRAADVKRQVSDQQKEDGTK